MAHLFCGCTEDAPTKQTEFKHIYISSHNYEASSNLIRREKKNFFDYLAK